MSSQQDTSHVLSEHADSVEQCIHTGNVHGLGEALLCGVEGMTVPDYELFLDVFDEAIAEIRLVRDTGEVNEPLARRLQRMSRGLETTARAGLRPDGVVYQRLMRIGAMLDVYAAEPGRPLTNRRIESLEAAIDDLRNIYTITNGFSTAYDHLAAAGRVTVDPYTADYIVYR
jgi:hypothetical protein